MQTINNVGTNETIYARKWLNIMQNHIHLNFYIYCSFSNSTYTMLYYIQRLITSHSRKKSEVHKNSKIYGNNQSYAEKDTAQIGTYDLLVGNPNNCYFIFHEKIITLRFFICYVTRKG